MNNQKKVYIIGIGMDGADTLTKAGLDAINKAKFIIGASRMLSSINAASDKKTLCTYDKDEIYNAVIQSDCDNIAVLMSGDTGFYSGTKGLIELMENDDNIELNVIAGISSPVYFSSKINIPWQDMKLLSAHGTDINVISNISRNRYTFILLGGKLSVSQIAIKLMKYNMSDAKIYLGENLGQDDEKITEGSVFDFLDYEESKLSVIVIENASYKKRPTFMSGISDEMFVRDSVPMTKSEIRAVIASALQIKSDDVCWDIGCGTGSVTVEMALAAYNGKVIAIDKNEQAVDLTMKNCINFGVDNVIVSHISAREVFSQNAVLMKKPDKVFIGGASEDIPFIVKKAMELNSNVKICFTAVSLETVATGIDLFEKLDKETQIKQISVVTTKKIGNHTMPCAANPIYIFSTK